MIAFAQRYAPGGAVLDCDQHGYRYAEPEWFTWCGGCDELVAYDTYQAAEDAVASHRCPGLTLGLPPVPEEDPRYPEAMDAIRAGRGISDAAAAAGLTYRDLQAWLARTGVSARAVRLESQIARIEDALAAGASIGSIADDEGLSRTALRLRMTRAGRPDLAARFRRRAA